MNPKRLFAIAAALALIVIIVFITRDQGTAAPPSDSAQGQAHGAGAAVARSGRKADPTAQPAAPQGTAAEGKVFVQGGWGSGLDEFGRHNEMESNPEAPLTITVDNEGNVYILDQVNGRVLRYDKNGKPLGSFPVTQQVPRDLVVSPTGTVLIMDPLKDKSVAVIDRDGKLLGELPIVGKNIAEKDSTSATGLFVDADGVYMEKAHAMQYRVGDAAGNPDPEQPAMDGRPSRSGDLLLSMGIINPLAGRFWVRALDRATGQMKLMREYTLPTPIMDLSFLDSDSSGRIYAAAHVGREKPIDPADGGRGGGFTDESIQLLCLTATGDVHKVLTLPANTMAEETVRDLALRDDGTIFYMYRSERGMQVLQYSCG